MRTSEFRVRLSRCTRTASHNMAGEPICSWFCPLVDVAGPCIACVVGMEERDLVAVAEGVGDQRWRGKGEVFVECGVPCAAQVDAETAEPVHDGVRVKVLPGSCPREEPGTLGV